MCGCKCSIRGHTTIPKKSCAPIQGCLSASKGSKLVLQLVNSVCNSGPYIVCILKPKSPATANSSRCLSDLVSQVAALASREGQAMLIRLRHRHSRRWTARRQASWRTSWQAISRTKNWWDCNCVLHPGVGPNCIRCIHAGNSTVHSLSSASSESNQVSNQVSNQADLASIQFPTAFFQESHLNRFVKRCSSIARLHTIGTSAQGQPLTVLIVRSGISDTSSPPLPAFRYIGNLHGDEPTGRQLLLGLGEWLCDRS